MKYKVMGFMVGLVCLRFLFRVGVGGEGGGRGGGRREGGRVDGGRDGGW